MTALSRQSFSKVHSWMGLIVGWLLFAIFVSGTLGYFQVEIGRWMQPEIVGTTTPYEAAEQAVERLRVDAAQASEWLVFLPNPRSPLTRMIWSGPGKDQGRNIEVGASGQEVAPRQTAGGRFFYDLHFNLYAVPFWPLSRWITGFCAMAMLLAVVTGIVTHKKLFADFFTLRLNKGQRSWLDAHNAAGVLILPFLLMMGYTGLVTSMGFLMPWPVKAAYADPAEFGRALNPPGPSFQPSGRSAQLTPIGPVLERASAIWGGRDPGFVKVWSPGDAASVIEVAPAALGRINIRARDMLYFDGVTGRALTDIHPPALGGAQTVEGTLFGLHAGRYASPVLRWLYVLSGLTGTAMIGAGLILWTVKRRARLPNPARPPFGFRLVEILNVTTIAGFPAAIAVYFLANRLLPIDLAERGAWEIHSLFMAWGIALFWSALRPSRRAWIEVLAAAALLFAAIPLVNALTTTRGLVPSFAAHDWLFVTFDSAALLAAILAGLAAWKLCIGPAPAVRASRSRQRASA